MGALVAIPHEPRCCAQQSELNRRELLALGTLGLAAGAPVTASADAAAEQLTWAPDVAASPTWRIRLWFDSGFAYAAPLEDITIRGA
jgi:hypothetical protein